ncbi:MAG: nucleotidyltransferase domain-containing protein [Acidobacteria bacterium]|nr:nucleotidyltransferase domain-containing protein [Acidobacteriota bacterium]
MPELIEQRAELERICREHRVRKLELFGSAATGSFKPDRSDLDFLIEFEDIPSRDYADTYFGLHEALEGLFGRSVDLVTAGSVKNPYLLESISRSKALLYAS